MVDIDWYMLAFTFWSELCKDCCRIHNWQTRTIKDLFINILKGQILVNIFSDFYIYFYCYTQKIVFKKKDRLNHFKRPKSF